MIIILLIINNYFRVFYNLIIVNKQILCSIKAKVYNKI